MRGGVTIGAPNTPITINMPAGSNGDDVVNALQNYARRNGSLAIPVTGNQRF
jgi:hypothetical protein